MVSGEAFHTRSPFSFDDVQRLKKKKNEFQICRNVKDYTLLIVHQFLLIWKNWFEKKNLHIDFLSKKMVNIWCNSYND